MIHQGNALSIVTDLTNQGEHWTIESGSSSHMTSNRHIFSSYKPSYGDRFVKIADGSFTKVVGDG